MSCCVGFNCSALYVTEKKDDQILYMSRPTGLENERRLPNINFSSSFNRQNNQQLYTRMVYLGRLGYSRRLSQSPTYSEFMK